MTPSSGGKGESAMQRSAFYGDWARKTPLHSFSLREQRGKKRIQIKKREQRGQLLSQGEKSLFSLEREVASEEAGQRRDER